MDGSRAMRPLGSCLAWVLIALLPGSAAPAAVQAANATHAANAAPPEPAAPAAAEVSGAGAAGEPLSFKAYLAEVAASNFDYAAARYNVSIAEAQLVAAKVFPNPTLNGGTAGRDVTHHGELREPANDDAGVTQTIELGGKRRKRVAVAQANLAQAAATLEDFFRTLRGKLFSYQHGAATLLDVLNAQRAQNDVRLAYVAALDERAKALIGVEQAAGIWDVDF